MLATHVGARRLLSVDFATSLTECLRNRRQCRCLQFCVQIADAAEVRKCCDLCLVISTHMPTELEISFVEVREENVEQLKVLNRAIFPINYQDRIYKDILASGQVTQLAYHREVLVGAIACRLEAHGTSAKMYIVTLGVLAPYRGMRVGSGLLEQSLFEACQDSNIQEAYLHVQTNNEEAIRFYKQFGFVLGEIVANYYKRLTPPDAVILRRTLVPQA